MADKPDGLGVDEILEQICSDYRDVVQKKGLTFEQSRASRRVRVAGSPPRLAFFFHNAIAEYNSAHDVTDTRL